MNQNKHVETTNPVEKNTLKFIYSFCYCLLYVTTVMMMRFAAKIHFHTAKPETR